MIVNTKMFFSKVIVLILQLLIQKLNCDCGQPGLTFLSPIIGNTAKNYPEGRQVTYECLWGSMLFYDKVRTCINGKWTGRVPKCAFNESPTLLITNYEIQKFDQNLTSKIISLNQTFEEFSTNCTDFESGNDLNFNLIYSPPERISVVELYFKANLTHLDVDYDYNTLRVKLEINIFVSPFRNCISKQIEEYSNETYGDNLKHWVFLCELNSLEDYNKETIIPNSMRFSFKSEIKFLLRICKILVHRFEDECGVPDIPIGASTLLSDDGRTIEIFEPSHGKRYRIIGNNTLKCAFDGNWDKEPPIFEPMIQCDRTNLNLSIYKSIEYKNLGFVNETEVAVFDSKVLFECNNGENSSKILVSICNENGLWTGDDLNCEVKNTLDADQRHQPFDRYLVKHPPIFEPEIQCNLTNLNSNTYKSIKFLDLRSFNETEVAVINSKVLFECNNGENSSKIRVSICNENGSWIGDDFNCEINNISERSPLFPTVIILISTLVLALIICTIIGAVFIFRNRKLRKNQIKSDLKNANYVEFGLGSEKYDDTRNIYSENRYETISIDEDYGFEEYDQINYDQFNDKENKTVEYLEITHKF